MKFTVEKRPNSEVLLDVELDWEDLEKASDRAYKNLAQKHVIPGFRRGHAPRSILERMIGKEAIYQEGLDELISQSYTKALNENEIIPLAKPELDLPSFELGQPFHYKATVPVLSPAELGDYKSLHLEMEPQSVSDEEFEKVMVNLQDQHAIWVPAERAAQIGDRVTVDLVLTVGERTISNLTDNEFELVSEREGLFTGLDQQIVGKNEGEEFDFSAIIPESYINTELAEKEAFYHVAVKNIKRKDTPEMSDEFAKTIGDFDSLAALRKAVYEQILQQKKQQALQALQQQIVDAVTEQTTFIIHPLLIEEEIDAMIAQTKQHLEQNNLSFEDFLKYSSKTLNEYREEIKNDAEKRVKQGLTLEAVAKAENISVNAAEVQSLLDIYAQMGGQRTRVDQLQTDQQQQLAARIRKEKTIYRLQSLIAPESLESTEDNASSAAVEAELAVAASEENSSES